LDQIGSTTFGVSAHLFCINVCVAIFKLVLIRLLNCQDPIKVNKRISWPLLPHHQLDRFFSSVFVM
jgi:hypothetical protein